MNHLKARDSPLFYHIKGDPCLKGAVFDGSKVCQEWRKKVRLATKAAKEKSAKMRRRYGRYGPSAHAVDGAKKNGTDTAFWVDGSKTEMGVVLSCSLMFPPEIIIWGFP